MPPACLSNQYKHQPKDLIEHLQPQDPKSYNTGILVLFPFLQRKTSSKRSAMLKRTNKQLKQEAKKHWIKKSQIKFGGREGYYNIEHIPAGGSAATL